MSVAPPKLRWSAAKTCPRMACYQADNAPHRDLTRVEENRLRRGVEIGHAYVIRLAQSNGWKVHVASGRDFMLPYPEWRADNAGDADALAELQVPWALGVGHPDLFVKETDTVIEVLSSQSATQEYMRAKLRQARGYADGLDASSICVSIVDPVTLDEDKIIVSNTAPLWDELGEEVVERVEQVVRWNETGELPPRVCEQPQEAFSRFCRFGAHCFENWEAPGPDSEIVSEAAQLNAIRLAHVKEQRRVLAATDRGLKREQKDIEEELSAEVPAGKHQVGGYLVNRSVRAGRRSFDYTRAELDGRFPDGLLDEFTRVGDPHEVWTVEKTGPAVVVDDDEDIPF